MSNNKLLPKLLQNLTEILNDEEYYDITIEVGNDPYIKIFRAHMVILHYRSPYLRRILSINKKKNDGTLAHIKLPNISPEIFQIILRYIYGGNLSLKEYDNLDIIQILIAANELSLQELIPYLQSFLIENKANWMEQNFNLIYQTSFENDFFSELQKYCTDLMTKEPNKIFNSLNFSSIPEKLLITIIQNDNLQMSEIQVWEHVLKWGHAQHPELPSNNLIVKDSNEILGGYNPIIWESSYVWGVTKNTSFIFSFNNDRIEDHVLSRVMNKNCAIRNGSAYGPSFGNGDLIVWDFGSSHCKKRSYEKPIRKTKNNFAIEECEVFQILVGQ
ncbi:BTB/POZ protein [Rhizophagus irregularis DAOM 181602=DAOM 197198]|nr:BTB/POZ protein [Rhizophagus irregularis DAOM 181602=DAOM 197198]